MNQSKNKEPQRLYSVTFVARLLGTSPASIHAYLAGQRKGNPRHVDFPAPTAKKIDDPDVPNVGSPLWNDAGLEAIARWYSQYLATMFKLDTVERRYDQQRAAKNDRHPEEDSQDG